MSSVFLMRVQSETLKLERGGLLRRTCTCHLRDARCCVVHVVQRVLKTVGVKLFPFNGIEVIRDLCRLLTLLDHDDAAGEKMFFCVHQPAPPLSVQRVIKSCRTFSCAAVMTPRHSVTSAQNALHLCMAAQPLGPPPPDPPPSRTSVFSASVVATPAPTPELLFQRACASGFVQK